MRATKGLGQHFLRDQRVVGRIVQRFQPTASDILVEIGPGRGALTVELLKCGARLHVIELDAALVQKLCRTIENPRLVVHHADALGFDYCGLRERHQPIRLIGNLPYNISTPLLFWLLGQSRCIADMCFMLQKEVVQRLTAQPGTKDYGRLSVMVQWRCQVEPFLTVGPSAFVPPPRVDSAVVQLVPYLDPPVEVRNPKRFAAIVRQAFSQRRKTLRNALRPMLDEAAIADAGVDPSVRAERVSVAEFARLSMAGCGSYRASRSA